MADVNCHKILMKALDYDERGDKEKAIQYYTEAVELIISIDDKDKREKLNKFAKQALDRAEELKGIKHQNLDPAKSTVPVQSASSYGGNKDHNKSVVSPTVPKHSPKLEIIAKESYTMDEKKVLEKSSLINSRIYIPFMEIDTKEKFVFPIPFTDKDGMLELAPKQKKEFQGWMRISDLCENPSIIMGSHADFYSIRQTVVSDCSFVASLSVAALYEKKFNRRILTSIIHPRNSKDEPVYNSSGKYTVKLFVNGIARKIVIDDYLPVGRYNQLLCSYSSNKSEFWVSLMEKAYMKLMGGYDFPGSNSNIDCYALTGWIPERITLRGKDEDFDSNGVFYRLKEGFHEGRCLITVATGELSDSECDRTGLVATHAFAVINLAEVDGVKLLMLKNPWSHLRWKGNYSEQDTIHWTPELQKTLNYDPKLAQTVDNGVFWIDYRSLLNFFDVFYLNWDPELFKYTYCTHLSWHAGTGPIKDAYNVGDNPQFSLNVPAGRGSIYVLLTRHITSIEDFRENKEYITLLVYNHKRGKRVYYPHDPAPFLDGIRINSPHYLCKIRLDDAPRKYTLVVSQYEKSTTIFYTLRAYSRVPFELKEINSSWATNIQVNGEWNTANATAGGCQNHKTYKSNPLYKVTLPNDGNLVIELRGPKVYQVGLELTVSHLEDSNVTAPFISKTTETFRSGFCVLDIENLPAGVYMIRPSTYLPNQEAPFFLKLKSTVKLQIEKER